MFYRWGDFAYKHRHLVPLIIVAAILLLFGLQGTKLADRMSQEGWDDPNSSSTHAAQIELETFGRDNSGDVILLIKSEGKTLDDPAVYDAMHKHLTGLPQSKPDQIQHVTTYFDKKNQQLINKDRTVSFAAIGLKGDGEQTLKDFRLAEDAFVPSGLPEGVTVEVAGATAVADALEGGMAADVQRAELIALPVVALLLLFVFGSVVAASMPLIVGILSILGSLGVLSMLATQAQVNTFAQSVVTLLGLGLAIDYGLFMVSRFREEMDDGKDIRTAVATTTATAGQTVVFSAAMVAVALSGLFVFPQAFLKSIAYGAISAVGLAALLSITVLPALFGILGKNIDKWSVRKSAARTARTWENTIWAKIPTWAMKHSGVVTVGIVTALLALTLPLVGIKFGGINETFLPPSNEVRQTQAQFDEQFPSFRTEPIKLVVTGADNNQIVGIYQQANAIEGLTGRFNITRPTKDGTTVLAAGIQDREYNESVVNQLRNIEVPEGVNLYIGGTPALEIESIEALMDKLPWMAIYVLVATFILMALVFGSLILPAKAVIMTVLGLGTTLGILTAMFVDGVGGSVFDFTAGPLMSPVLVLIMAIIYGLSTDYEVFLLSRMVEARNRGESTDTAIRYGTAHTGSIITAAALIMIVVCGAFGFSDIVMMKYIAFGMIAALILDATVIRMLLVPAVMHLLREDNWWAPGFVKKASYFLGHAGEQRAPATKYVPAERPEEQPAEAQPVRQEPRPEVAPTQTVHDDWDTHEHAAENVEKQQPTAIRSGRSVEEDEELIPFAELMRRLKEDRK